MKKIFTILIFLLIANSAFALETPMKKLSKYFKTGELIKISSYTVPGDPCITRGAKIGGNKGGAFKKPFLKFFTENLLN